MKVTTMGGRSTGKTMAQLKQENDALKEQLSFLAGRVATLNEFCQVNNIGEWGDSVVSAVIKHCDGQAAKNAALVARIACIESVSQDALGFLPRDVAQRLAEAVGLSHEQALAEIEAEAILEAVQFCANGLTVKARALWDYAETIRESAKVRESPKIEL